MRLTTTILLGSAALGLTASGLALAQSAMTPTAAPPPPPPKTATMPPKASPDMQKVLDQLGALGGRPIETLTPAEARVQPTPTDAVMALMKKNGMPTGPDPAVTSTDKAYGSDPLQVARIYRPAVARPGDMLPVVVYFHGGGWVIADLDVYAATPQYLAKTLKAIVVSVEYRKAPEAKFPAQHEDAAAAYRWVLDNAKSWGGDPSRVALAGESAGGNLAVSTAIYVRDHGLTMPLAILAVYPIANSSMMLPSRKDSANAKPLNAAMLKWFGYYYARSPADMQDPRVNLVAANLKGLPPTTIVNAQIDPLRSDGETLATALRRAGVNVQQRTFAGVTHEFFGMGKVVKGAADAEAYGAARMKVAFAIKPMKVKK